MLSIVLSGALAIGATSVVEQWCPLDSIPTSPACPGGCVSSVSLVRAAEIDGTRHVAWTLASGPNVLYSAREEMDGTWTLASQPGPTGTAARQLALDGNLLAVAWAAQVNLFRLVDGAWTPEATLTSAAPNFAASVAVWSPAGGPERVVVGAAVQQGTGPAGSATVFRKDAGWIVEQVLNAPPGLGSPAAFGRAVAIDGERIAVSAPDTNTATYNGPLSIFERQDGTWSQASTIAVPTWLEPQLGNRLALRGDTLAAVNGSFVSLTTPTRVQVFHRSGGTWSPTELLQAEGNATQFGRDLAMRLDGADVQLTIAAYQLTNNDILTGAWLYRLHQGIVIHETRLRNPKSLLDGPDVSTPGAFLVDGATPWAALAAPTALGGSAIRIVQLDACPATADLNGDGIVNGADLGILLGNWGNAGVGDLNGDGVVNGADLGILLGAWS
ncbi:MAG: hypothetical protein U0575_15310 [Phycisphaerales bacterium]